MTTIDRRSLVNTIESEIQRVQNDLRGVDEKMRRLNGWQSFGENNPRSKDRRERVSSFADDDEPPAKRRSFGGVFARLGGGQDVRRDNRSREEGDYPIRGGMNRERGHKRIMEERSMDVLEEDDGTPKPSIASSVTRPAIDMKSRMEAAASLTKDRASRDRNRRMFGNLLGTLQRFRNDEAKQKDKEEQRAKIDRKLEEKGKQEKEEMRREAQVLFNRKKEDQAKIHRLQMKMARVKEHENWEEHQRSLAKFIRTKASPNLFWCPKISNSKTNRLLSATKEVIENEIEDQKLKLKDELEQLVGRPSIDEDRDLDDIEEGELSDLQGGMDARDNRRPNKNRVKGVLGRTILNNSRDLDYETEEGELVYERPDHLRLSGKNDQSTKRMVVQVASNSGGRGAERRVELVPDVLDGKKRKIRRKQEESSEDELENIRPVKMGKFRSSLDTDRYEKENSKREKAKTKKSEKKRHKEEKRKKKHTSSPRKEEPKKQKASELTNGNKVQAEKVPEEDSGDDLPPLPNDPVLDLGMGESEEEGEMPASPVSPNLISKIDNGPNIPLPAASNEKSEILEKAIPLVKNEIKVEKEPKSKTTESISNPTKSTSSQNLDDEDEENITMTLAQEMEIIKPRIRARWDVKEKMVVKEMVPIETPKITVIKKTITNTDSNNKNKDEGSVIKDKDTSVIESQAKQVDQKKERSSEKSVSDKKSMPEKKLTEKSVTDKKSTEKSVSDKNYNEKSSADKKSLEKNDKSSKSPELKAKSKEVVQSNKNEKKKTEKISPKSKSKPDKDGKKISKKSTNHSSDSDQSDKSPDRRRRRRGRSSSRSDHTSSESSGTSDSDSDSSSSSGDSSGHDSSPQKSKSTKDRKQRSYRRSDSRQKSDSDSDSEDERDRKGARSRKRSLSKSRNDKRDVSKRVDKGQSRGREDTKNRDSRNDRDRVRARERTSSRDDRKNNDRKSKR